MWATFPTFDEKSLLMKIMICIANRNHCQAKVPSRNIIENLVESINECVCIDKFLRVSKSSFGFLYTYDLKSNFWSWGWGWSRCWCHVTTQNVNNLSNSDYTNFSFNFDFNYDFNFNFDCISTFNIHFNFKLQLQVIWALRTLLIDYDLLTKRAASSEVIWKDVIAMSLHLTICFA